MSFAGRWKFPCADESCDDGAAISPIPFLPSLRARWAGGRHELLAGPIHGELLGRDQLAEKAREVAAREQVLPRAKKRGSAPLLTRLAQTRRILDDARERLSAGAGGGMDVGPAGDWLLDNFHIVQEHIAEVRESLPRGFYGELPELASGPLAGYPRVYELAIALISHSEARVDIDNLDLFVHAWQSAAPLSIGELWALPAMFRLALLESVRRMALRTVRRMDEIDRADDWAARIEAAHEEGAEALGAELDAFVDAPPNLSAVFIARFLRQLRHTRGSFVPLIRIEQWIEERARGLEEATARSTQQMALTQVIMANGINSLRSITHLDWRAFVERHSALDAVLRSDPAGYYERMTFATRDRYRHVVERIARRTGRTEESIARAAVEHARASRDTPRAPAVASHVGYYLEDDGRARLEAAAGYRPTAGEAMHRWVESHPNVVFVGGILVATAAALAAVLWLGGPAARSAWLLVLAFALIPAADIAIALVNQLVTALLPPRPIASLDLRGRTGVPHEYRTAVVMPTLFDSVDDVHAAFEHLEVQFLANRGDHLHFAVLSDFTDAATETCPTDDPIVSAAVNSVDALNARYAGGGADVFYLFHRPRRWNPRQGVWMGWERKRGKLAEFNRFLRGGARDAFTTVVGNIEPLHDVRYVITLDSDTVLPPDTASDLIGALAHPLNRAVYDPGRGRVTRGYGILQPRVGVSLPSAHRSRFASIHSGHPGVDPYATAVSDVYQDLYGEGSFTGKGIYDVDAFEKATHGRFPENTLLSHDLIEGSYARAGLATGITLYDDYPSRYLTFTRRKHRWIRGDWQLLRWLTPRVPGPDGPEKNRLSLLSRWKIVDNLRRSTVEIGQLAFLIAGWTVLPGSPLRWTALGLAAIAAPWIIALLLAALRPPLDRSWSAYYGAVLRDARTSAQQVGLAIAFLPHQAWVSADAIVRTLWRLLVTKRGMLEWQTASTAEVATSTGPIGVTRSMWPAIAIAIGVVVLASITSPGGPFLVLPWPLALSAAPLIALWIASPALAHALGVPAVRRRRQLTEIQRQQSLRLALLHWRFFDRFVTAETQWLAPDNFQEDPSPVVAMRTSPTNIGLQLLAIGSAHDLGFIDTAGMTQRVELVFRALERMRRHRGHFLNWYDLRDLRVLEPAYVSTVDSGNLAGHLLALRQACLRADEGTRFSSRVVDAIHTALDLATRRLSALAADDDVAGTRSAARIDDAAQHLARARTALAAAADAPSATDLTAVLTETWVALAAALDALRGAAIDELALASAEEWIAWSIERIRAQSESAAISPAELRARLDALADRAGAYVAEMDFRFLFDDRQELFSIGFNTSSAGLDPAFYDLFASESRLASFVAIAKNEIPVDHWFRLGRTLNHAAGETALVSWSGSMFEYLMPALVMRTLPFTLLDQAYRGAVRRHMAYGAERGVPWGVSESAYNVRDRDLTYQYRAFGVPDLALKRGLGRDLVIAPYASALALAVDPVRALDNLDALARTGALGPYGFRDALDYTRPEPGRSHAVVGNYMAHHIGMSLVALTNTLADDVWQERFHADPLIRSVELLLHERIPRRVALQDVQKTRADEALPDPDLESPVVREFDRPDSPRPHIGLLGRHPYTLMVSHCGSGYSRFEDLAVTRWRADGTADSTGQFCYVRDVATDAVWSVAHQPVCAPADWYRALLATDRVTFHRSDGGIETRTEIAVVPEDAAEVRSVTVTNHTRETREVELTSYGEIVLGPPDADRAHAAFANLFVETEWHEWCTAITATRRPRAAGERSLWCVHVVDRGGDSRIGDVTCETDRAHFVGRGRTPRAPLALTADGPLSGTTGAVLDPIFALRTRVRLEPGACASVAFTTLVADTRERAFELADRYHDPHTTQRALDLAWTSQQVELRELDLGAADAAFFQEMAGCLLYPHPDVRAPQAEMRRNHGSQEQLWTMGISGDWPIVVALIDHADGTPTLRRLLSAHHYWRRRGMTVDLVIINGRPASYLQELNDRIMETMFATNDAVLDRPGGVFVRRLDALDPDALLMLRATARLLVRCDGRSLEQVLAPLVLAESDDAGTVGEVDPLPRALESRRPPESRPAHRAHAYPAGIATPGPAAGPAPTGLPSTPAADDAPALLFDNGFGGLNEAGEYAMRVRTDHVPPAPWVNVVANPHGGFVVSERGAGYTWAASSYFFRLTPWHNDPVSDPASDVLYLRDVATGELWSATPAPLGGDATWDVRHAPGESVFEGERSRIATRLTLRMADAAPVRLSALRVTNRTTAPRRIEVTAYVEWTLGVLREHTQHQVRTEFDAETGAIFATNGFDAQFGRHVAFCALSEPLTGHTGDRREFLGRNGSVGDPAGLRAGVLLRRTGIGLDPCAAVQCILELAPGETREITVVLGAAEDATEAREAVARFRDAGAAARSAARGVELWRSRLSVVSVRTPDSAFDALLNHWLLYQALSCRMWGRSALYQSSGAYGFRDQLQDVLAFVYAEPGIAREHILRSAARQFAEGDVQHWWHPHSGQGVRTRFSDDLVWLPFVVDRYVTVTGDAAVFDEVVPFLSMRPLEPHEHEVYAQPAVTEEHASVYDHCVRALRRACTAGAHGLPLIGTGDWNDGMNRVGAEGRGESIWLAWFLVAALRGFAVRADERGDPAVARELRDRADAYVAAVEAHGWDGEWYRRAYFDDGTPLGSRESDECRIDSIAQSWSVISGGACAERQESAMRSLEEHLVDAGARLIRLLTPPFDRTAHDPGYIRGYLPGVRENGAQYTHAAIWAVLATALRGDGERAFELFQMLNPLLHACTQAQVETYKVEPYVVAADVYTAAGQVGRGGWTWYTGAAGWLYRVGLETILGFTVRGATVRIEPRVPASWPSFTIDYRFGTALYTITVEEPGRLASAGSEVLLHGVRLDDEEIPLVDDGMDHTVLVRPATAAPEPPREHARPPLPRS